MNATDFIKEHGVEKAREVLKAIPENQHWFSDVMMNETGRWVVMQAPALIHETGEKYISTFRLCKEWQPKFTKLKDLKCLVDSVDFINKFGRIDLAKVYDKQMSDHGFDTFFDKAISDYESIYSDNDTIFGD